MEELQRLLDRLVAAGAPGAAGWVQDDEGARQAASGVADLRTGRPMRPAPPFRAGSLTKSVVATVVPQLVAEGRLSLQDRLDCRLPGILPYGGQVTLRQLLDHASGVPTTGRPSSRRCPDPRGDAPASGPRGSWWPWWPTGRRTSHRHGLVVLQHRLPPARPGRGGGQRQHAR